MKFYQLGFRYLQRKKGKTILLLIVLILVNSMILGTSMILRTTNESKQAMQEKTNSKIVAEITSKDSKITENEVNKIETLEDVSSINRIGRQEVFPNNFAPVTLNTSTNEDNLKIALLSYDDLEKDSPFSEMQYRLASGDYIKREKKGAVINANLANQNGLKVGDTKYRKRNKSICSDYWNFHVRRKCGKRPANRNYGSQSNRKSSLY